jgi:hypothetical protein
MKKLPSVEERASELSQMKMCDTPILAQEYIKHLASTLGICSEIYVAGYMMYAYVTEQLEFDNKDNVPTVDDVHKYDDVVYNKKYEVFRDRMNKFNDEYEIHMECPKCHMPYVYSGTKMSRNGCHTYQPECNCNGNQVVNIRAIEPGNLADIKNIHRRLSKKYENIS